MDLLSLGTSFTDFCANDDMRSLIGLIGAIISVVKIAIPLIIIALGIFDFGKAVVADKEEEVKKQTKRLIYRIVAGIVIYFVPSIVLFIFGQIGLYQTEQEQTDFKQCQECFLHPADCN